MSSRHRQQGVALITAMLVVAIGTMIAVNLMWEGTLDLRRAEAALAADQGLMYGQGAEAWAADILRQDLVDSPDSDHLSEQWAIELPPLPVDGGTITGKLEDLQGRFNLNNLIAADGMENELARRQFERLLNLVEIDPGLAGAVVDWLDPDTELRFPTGGEDVVYSSQDPPYRTANAMITSASELMAIAGFDRESYSAVGALRHGAAARHEAQRQYGVGRRAGVAVGQHRHRDGRDIDRGARRSRVRRHRRHVFRPRRARCTAGDRRRQRAFFVDRNGDARFKSAHDALGAAA